MNVKKFLYMLIFVIIEMGVPIVLASSGMGYTHWQWWMVWIGIVSAYFIGLSDGGLD